MAVGVRYTGRAQLPRVLQEQAHQGADMQGVREDGGRSRGWGADKDSKMEEHQREANAGAEGCSARVISGHIEGRVAAAAEGCCGRQRKAGKAKLGSLDLWGDQAF